MKASGKRKQCTILVSGMDRGSGRLVVRWVELSCPPCLLIRSVFVKVLNTQRPTGQWERPQWSSYAEFPDSPCFVKKSFLNRRIKQPHDEKKKLGFVCAVERPWAQTEQRKARAVRVSIWQQRSQQSAGASVTANKCCSFSWPTFPCCLPTVGRERRGR